MFRAHDLYPNSATLPHPTAMVLPPLRGKAAGVSPEDELRWRKWVDERFVKLLTANIYRSWE